MILTYFFHEYLSDIELGYLEWKTTEGCEFCKTIFGP